MQAGKLDRRIRLERATFVRDDLNEMIEAWGELATVWASKLDVSDSERVRAKSVAADISARFQIRYSSRVEDLNPKDRLVYRGKTYDIVGVKEIGRREGLEISAIARSDLAPQLQPTPEVP